MSSEQGPCIPTPEKIQWPHPRMSTVLANDKNILPKGSRGEFLVSHKKKKEERGVSINLVEVCVLIDPCILTSYVSLILVSYISS